MHKTTRIFHLSIMGFWLLYFLITSITNFFDLFITLNWLDSNFLFASHNYSLIEAVFAEYAWLGWPAMICFFAIALAEAALCFVFILAFKNYMMRGNDLKMAKIAITSSMMLWMALILGQEFFTIYQFSETAVRLMIAAIVSALGLYLIKD